MENNKEIKKGTIRNLKIREVINVQHQIIEVIEESRLRWFEDDKNWQNSKNDAGVDWRGNEEKGEGWGTVDEWSKEGAWSAKGFTEEDS